MALVRCPIHDIPYNDENPRGCPVCYREKKGEDEEAQAIHELARVSRAIHRPSGVDTAHPPAPTATPAPPTRPVTTPPRRPTVTESAFSRLLRRAGERRVLTLGAVVAAALLAYLWSASGPRFVEGWDPPRVVSDVRPIAIQPGQPVDIVFSVLGPRAPQAHPDVPRLARYSYGTDLFVDALNGLVSQLTIQVANRSWRGLRVGLSEREARGTLALLGSPREVDASPAVAPHMIGGYAVYDSMEARPRRILTAEVRPPNGCFDAILDLQPQAVGVLITDENRYAVIGRENARLEWVVTRVRVVSRAMASPEGEPAVC